MEATKKMPAFESKTNAKRKRLTVIVSKSKKNNQYWLTLQSSNGNKLMHTETYKAKRSAYKIVKLLNSIIDDTKVYLQIKDTTTDGLRNRHQKANGRQA